MKIHRRAFTELFAGLGVLAATPALAQGNTVEVSMKNNPKGVFVPATVNIKVGDTVKWTNPGIITHTVTFDPAQAATASNVVLPAGVAPFVEHDDCGFAAEARFDSVTASGAAALSRPHGPAPAAPSA